MGIRLNVCSSVFPEIDGKIISAHCSGAPATKETMASFVLKTEEAQLKSLFVLVSLLTGMIPKLCVLFDWRGPASALSV